MTRIADHLAAIETWLAALPHGNAPLVREVRRQLDLVDAEDLERQSFASPAGFLALPRFRLVPRPDGGRDAEIWLFIAIAARGSAARSMDIEVIDRVVTLAAALDDQDFGQVQCSPASDIEARPVLQAALETRGLAVAAVSFRQVLYRITPAHAAITGGQEVPGAGGLLPSKNGPGPVLSAEEQAIVDRWGECAP